VMLDWTLRRVVKLGLTQISSTVKERLARALPFEILWTPIDMGGVGMLPWTMVDPNVDEMIRIWPMHEDIKVIMNRYYHIYKKFKGNRLDKFVSAAMPAFEKGYLMYKHLTYSNKDRFELSKKAEDQLLLLGGRPDRNAYYKKDKIEIYESLMASPKTAEIRRMEIKDKYRFIMEEYVKDINCEDYIEQGKFFKIVEGEILSNRLQLCPIGGIQDDLALWIMQLGVSNETFRSVDLLFRALKEVINDPYFPSHLSANRPEAIARELLKEKYNSLDAIGAFLMMRGASSEKALSAASVIIQNLDKLMFVTEISQYSLAGEGFTDKSVYNVNRCVTLGPSLLTETDSVVNNLKQLGFQYVRNRDMRINGVLRKVTIIPTAKFVKERQVSLYGNSISMYPDQLFDLNC